MSAQDILTRRDAEMSEGGRGLEIVRRLSDDLAVFHGSITIVRAAKYLPSPGAPEKGLTLEGGSRS